MGSSPLTRGKRGDLRVRRDRQGLIPAHAGKTKTTTRRSATAWAHPRSRGENNGAFPALRQWHGSSPLTQGKHSLWEPPSPVVRLIPAHAGKTAGPRVRSRPRWAHHRSCGENIDAWELPERHVGSSPLTRGKLVALRNDRVVAGLIPTHAGKTASPPE